MDEYNQGWDPEVKTYFKKILNSFVAGAMFMLTFSTAGLFFRLGFIGGGWQWYNILFYAVMVAAFFLLLFYYYRLWQKKAETGQEE